MPAFLLFAAALAGPAAAAPAPAAAAAPPAPRSMTCPIGGGAFDFAPPARPVAFGERPDGRPYGSGTFPPPLPECPDNGLVLYKDYSAAEVAKLEPLVASEAYQALRKDDTQYYRAFWLMKAMGVAPERYLVALLQAGWEAAGRPELRNRYLAELAELSARVPARRADLNWIGMEGRAVNALRELGRFDEARARLDKLPLADLEAEAGTGPAAATGEAAQLARARRGWLAFLRNIRPVIERKDASAEPLDLIPHSIAYGRCLDHTDALDDAGHAFCAQESAGVEELRAARERLKQSRDASGR